LGKNELKFFVVSS